ncbi:proline-rich protein 2-like [Sorex araneus]|uniref:proline-rich protein 2-like n=1 Tax=Sorex araneus TaxID=42254 RepID=UPI002433689E|nr:proline-rich protein 2-like [Sorex araneus]
MRVRQRQRQPSPGSVVPEPELRASPERARRGRGAAGPDRAPSGAHSPPYLGRARSRCAASPASWAPPRLPPRRAGTVPLALPAGRHAPPAPRSRADATEPAAAQQRLPLPPPPPPPRERPPRCGAAGDHRRALIGLRAPGPADVSGSLIRATPTEAGLGAAPAAGGAERLEWTRRPGRERCPRAGEFARCPRGLPGGHLKARVLPERRRGEPSWSTGRRSNCLPDPTGVACNHKASQGMPTLWPSGPAAFGSRETSKCKHRFAGCCIPHRSGNGLFKFQGRQWNFTT